MGTDNAVKHRAEKAGTTPLNDHTSIHLFLNQKRHAFKTTLQQLAEYGVTIRSFTELQNHVTDIENGLPITQQLIIQAYHHASLVSTVEALLKHSEEQESVSSGVQRPRPRRDEGQQREPDGGTQHI